ncbi:uncharacterized protein APUU_70525A [Aspergillus puulaauensis]|uniref:Uncharacterized protein n=1 Tax=Aspergillus puulaauensis TaxID=1220207 RepID=A0A7R7XWE7_9EURO|nr:uncharacterized protein APUU_70525A [Aspergillus puulaauensis]BCS28955.1 hypothetical protein APUU_70525A [Aspergillus puulaauensis]
MTPIEEIIPLYLADRISLDSAIQSASQIPRTPLLLTALKESRSLPRSIDTDPTTPTPDLPSPSQDKLLQLIRALDSRARAQDRDSGIALDDLISTPGYGSEAEEQYNALHVFTNEAVRDFAACFLHSGYGYGSVPSPTSARRQSHGQTRRSIRSSLFRARSETRYLDSDVNADVDADVDTFADEHADPSTDVPISSGPASGSGLGHRRRRSSGVEKHLYNLVSFLAFLTKEKLLLYPNVGERVVVEMVSETLYHPPSHSHLHSHSHSNSQSQPRSWNPNRNRNRNRSHTVPQDVGSDSKGKGKGNGREETVAVAVSHEPWFGFVSATGPGNEVSVTAVALWLIIMGEELYQRARMERRERRARLKSTSKGVAEGEGEEGGDVWTRLSEVVGREWKTWTSRLQFLSLREDMGISAREHAAEAAAVMRRVYDYE